MSLSRRKAEEKFGLYKAAELKGEDELAVQLEKELNEGGWKIVSGPSGLTIEKVGSGDGFLSGIKGDFFGPRETSDPLVFTGSQKSRGISTTQIVVMSVTGLVLVTGIVLY